MSKFQMFDSIALNQHIQLHSGGIAPQGTGSFPKMTNIANCVKRYWQENNHES